MPNPAGASQPTLASADLPAPGGKARLRVVKVATGEAIAEDDFVGGFFHFHPGGYQRAVVVAHVFDPRTPGLKYVVYDWDLGKKAVAKLKEATAPEPPQVAIGADGKIAVVVPNPDGEYIHYWPADERGQSKDARTTEYDHRLGVSFSADERRLIVSALTAGPSKATTTVKDARMTTTTNATGTTESPQSISLVRTAAARFRGGTDAARPHGGRRDPGVRLGDSGEGERADTAAGGKRGTGLGALVGLDGKSWMSSDSYAPPTDNRPPCPFSEPCERLPVLVVIADASR